jgi:arginyl-tRNA synthetase
MPKKLVSPSKKPLDEGLREQLFSAISSAYPNAKITLDDIQLEHPANEENGDFATNIAFKIQKSRSGGQKNFLDNIERFWAEVSEDNFKNCGLELPVGKLAGNELVWLRAVTFAKIRGWREKEGFSGHTEIGKNIFYLIPFILRNPTHQIWVTSDQTRLLLVVDFGKLISLVVEIGSKKGKNWLVTAFLTKRRYLEKREKDCLIHKKSVSLRGLPEPPILASTGWQSGGSRFSTLQDTKQFYNTLSPESQEKILFYEEESDSPYQIAEKIAAQLNKKFPCARKTRSQGFGTWSLGQSEQSGQSKVEEFQKSELEKIEAKNGFINFYLSPKFLVSQMQEVLEKREKYGQIHSIADTLQRSSTAVRKIVIEIVSPNINKPLHIGHLRNAALGMSLANLYKANGWQVIKDEINNDRGLHIMKAAYGYLLFGQLNPVKTQDWQELLDLWLANPKLFKTPKSENQKPDYFVGSYYVLGEKFLTESEELANKQLSEMLQAWEAGEKNIWKLWEVMGGWVHEGIDATYKRIGVAHDKKWYEHKLYQEGKAVIADGVKKGLLEKLPDGAIQANLEEYGLANKILVRRDKTAIYMTFDIALTKHKVSQFKADKYVWVVGNDQIDHFKRLFAIFDLLKMGKIDQFYHLAYGMVRVPGGKMSSRLGNVILADDLLDKVKEATAKLNPQTAEEVAVGAVKYALLKVDPMIDVVFDLDKSVALDGDSGVYLQYTFARARSVIRRSENSDNQKIQKTGMSENSDKSDNLKFRNSGALSFLISPEELAILRFLPRFPEVVEAAAVQYSPNLLCTNLFELAKKFNNLYNNCPILGVKKSFLENIDWLVKTINKDNFENYKEPIPVGRLSTETQKVIGAKTDLVYLKPRIYAKWCGWWREHRGHEEILPFIGYLPSVCFAPLAVYKDRKGKDRFLLSFDVGHFGMLVIEIIDGEEKNEIVTAFYFDKLRLGEYEELLSLKESSLGKLRPASLLAPRHNAGVAGAISSLQESQEFYTTLDSKSQQEILFYDTGNSNFRLQLTQAVSIILKSGLKLLGIEALERM